MESTSKRETPKSKWAIFKAILMISLGVSFVGLVIAMHFNAPEPIATFLALTFVASMLIFFPFAITEMVQAFKAPYNTEEHEPFKKILQNAKQNSPNLTIELERRARIVKTTNWLSAPFAVCFTILIIFSRLTGDWFHFRLSLLFLTPIFILSMIAMPSRGYIKKHANKKSEPPDPLL